MAWACQGWHGGPRVIGVALLGNALASDCGSAQTRIQPGGAKLGIGLTLTLDEGFEVRQSGGQVVLHALPATGRAGLQTGDPALQHMGALADGDTAPAEFTLCAPLAPRASVFDGACHKDAAGTACKGPRCVHDQGFEGIRALHKGGLQQVVVWSIPRKLG
jgi:hypothetical protein